MTKQKQIFTYVTALGLQFQISPVVGDREILITLTYGANNHRCKFAFPCVIPSFKIDLQVTSFGKSIFLVFLYSSNTFRKWPKLSSNMRHWPCPLMWYSDPQERLSLLSNSSPFWHKCFLNSKIFFDQFFFGQKFLVIKTFEFFVCLNLFDQFLLVKFSFD